MAKINITQKFSAFIVMMLALFFYSACRPSHKQEVDRLNTLSYAYHYRDLDSTKMLAQRALALSGDYSAGYAEACNNLAFVEMAKMNYKEARRWLGLVEEKSNNQLELLIADVQMMRICQRESHNKDFYSYREKAMVRLRRLGEEASNLPPRERRRATYAHSEFDIVDATYCYYVGLEEPMLKALNDIDADALEADTAQYLNYLYNIGSGGAITNGSSEQIAQTEFDYLIQCYMLASAGRVVMSDGTMAGGYPYWQANALQALSEHLQNGRMRDFLIRNNLPAIQYLNVEQMPDTLLAGNLAQRALNLFISYGDTYQIAGGYRTLAECYFAIEDYNSAGDCLLRALQVSKNIKAAPDLVASIRERLCLVYSALDNKQQSDYNRNIYLDLQERTRQDRQLEARATLLDDNALQLNLMIAAVLVMILLVVILLYLFDRMRRRKIQSKPLSSLLEPLEQWKQRNTQYINDINEITEELNEEISIARLHLDDNKKRNLEQRAKVSLVNSITPFIDRMIHEANRLSEGGESDEVRQERYQYIAELTDKINQYNNVLTEWIQMRQGSLSLRIESFPLQQLFNIVAKGKMSFQMQGVKLEVEPTDAVVKADRILTLFMINTIADNARKFTPEGGKVTISAKVSDFVEISISDTGKGMDEEQLAHVFDRTYTGGHGFGLLNCKGIIEKYKKVSSLFAGCQIKAESKLGEGSRFSFRLPKGIARRTHQLLGIIIMLFVLLSASVQPCEAKKANGIRQRHNHLKTNVDANLQRADDFADSAYFSNIAGTYQRTLAFADSSRHYLNAFYLSKYPDGKYLMVAHPEVGMAAELYWMREGLRTNYHVILDLRNECAVAALALHQWSLYQSNNKVYTQLFREISADNTLANYVHTMQQSENSKTVAVVLLILLLLQLPLAYYLLYYRHVLSYRFAMIEQTKAKRTDEAEQESLKLELMTDELHRAEYENDKLHISNSVLDNCLSTLKHETMYYPSRIRQLIDSQPDDVDSLKELVDYYKSLYSLLSAQAMEQVEGNIKADDFLNRYLVSLMRGNSKDYHAGVAEIPGSAYVRYWVDQQDVAYDAALHAQLFTPLTGDLRYLLCRQIVRELGEITNLRGCGIKACQSNKGCLRIEAVLPARMKWESLKS